MSLYKRKNLMIIIDYKRQTLRRILCVKCDVILSKFLSMLKVLLSQLKETKKNSAPVHKPLTLSNTQYFYLAEELTH